MIAWKSVEMGFIALLLEISSLVVLLSADTNLLFANRKDLRVVNVAFNQTSSTSEAIIEGLEDAAALDFLYSQGAVFWTDVILEMIRKKDVSSGTVEDVISTGVISPDGLACDWVGLKLYWTDADNDRIEVSELNGTSRKVLVWEEIDQPRAVTLDPRRGYLFWSDWGEEPKIERAGMDGTERTVIINDHIEWPNGLTVDYDTSLLFWTDAKLRYIHHCLIDGSNRTILLEGITPHPFALSVFQDTVYWTDWDTKSIHACDKYTGQMRNPVLENLLWPMDIHVYSPDRQPSRADNPCAENGNCSHLCLLSPQPPFYSCACPTGVRLLQDGRTCASGAENILLLARRRDIRRISLDTPDYTSIVIPLKNIKHAIAIDYDPVDDYVYWTDDEIKAIRRVKLDGTGGEYIVTINLGTPDGIAVDWVARNIYWTDTFTKMIEVARLNGSFRKVVVKENIYKPRAIAVHPARGLMFWTDWGEDAKIERAALDGSDRRVLFNTSVLWPNGISIDYESDLVYWGDGKIDKIEVMDLDGRVRRILKEGFTHHVFGFSLLGDYIYWTDWQSRTIERCHKETGEEHEVLIEELPDLMGLVAVNVNHVSGSNPCGTNNGGCSHLCLYRPSGHICACPIGLELLADGLTCILPEAFLLLCFTDDVRRISLEATFNNEEIPLTGVKKATSLDFDFTDNMIYWSDQDAHKISKAYMNGTGREDVIEYGVAKPDVIAVDWVAHNIYFIVSFSSSNGPRIEVARLDGYSRRVLVWQNISIPQALCLDPASGYMYFADWDGQSSLERAYLDGTNRKTLLRPGRIKGLTIDYYEGRLYWANLDKPTIESSDMLGLDLREVGLGEQHNPIGLTQFRDYVYWIDHVSKTIERANKSDGSNNIVLQTFGDEIVIDLLVFHGSRQTGWNACGFNNSGCQHLCLSLPNKTSEWNYVCQCPTHYTLNADGKTCTAPEEFLLFSQKGKVRRLHKDFNEYPDMVLPIRGTKNVKAIEYDYEQDSLLWIDGRQKVIMISQSNGLENRVLVPGWTVVPATVDESAVTNNPFDLAVDPYSRRLYWTDSVTNVINVTGLDGTPIGVVLDNEQQYPRLITLIAEEGLMFWFNNNNQSPTIERANLDGEENQFVCWTGIENIRALTADPAGKRIYWIDEFLMEIESSDLLGSTRKTHLVLSSGTPVGLTISGDFLYWADKKLHHIKRINKMRTPKEGTPSQMVKYPVDSLTDVLAVGPRLQDRHPCATNNGGCSHLCIAKDGKARCSCPLHLSLIGEVNCAEPPTCSPNEFLCHSSTALCLPLSWKCDDAEDCEDGSDEIDCPSCAHTEFRCESGKCISMDLWCDGNIDCEGETDELHCTEPNCFSENLQCTNGDCLFGSWMLCDGEVDCEDGSDEEDCESGPEDSIVVGPEMSTVSHAAVGSLVSIGVVSLFVIGVILLVRRCPWNQGNVSSAYLSDQASNSYTFQLNHLGGEHSTQKYLSRHERRGGHIKSTNLHVCPTKTNTKFSSSSALYERNRPTGASSVSSDHVSSSNSSYPKETLNPPPSPVTVRSHYPTKIYYTPAHKSNTAVNTSRLYRHHKMGSIPPPPTPCSTDVCEDSDSIPQTHHKHTRRKKGYSKVPNIDPVNFDSEPYPPPPTPQYLSDSCPPSPSTGRSCFNPCPPPPSVATDSS